MPFREHFEYLTTWTDHHFESVLTFTDPILQVGYFLVIACHVVLHVGRQGCNFILSTLSYLIQLAVSVQNNGTATIPLHRQKMLLDLAKDVRTPAKKFHLDGKYTIYAICPNPKCHQTYKPSVGDSPTPKYPHRCTYPLSEGHNCDELLTQPKRISNTVVQIPIKPFVYFDFKDWIANLLSRPGYEDVMDSAWNRKIPDSGLFDDIFDASILRNFKGPDGNFFSMPETEGHYVFSLNVDFFNPNGNAGRKSISCGVIALICLNLSPELRYKPENMFLAGIIPGPHEPPLTCINHYLRPLVDDLVDFWTPGIWYSRTFKMPRGRKVVCALVALVCDLPAARKTAGFASHSHNFFCSVCNCTLKDHGCGNTEYEAWKRRTDEECRSHAEQWRTAGNQRDATALFNRSGMRWSELLRLPYFDISRYVVVDAMHNLFLGLVHTHFEDVLGFKNKKTQPQAVVSLGYISNTWETFTAKERKSVECIRNWLEQPMADKLKTNRNDWVTKFNRRHRRALQFFCKELQIPVPDLDNPKTNKICFTKALLEWVCSSLYQLENNDVMPPTTERKIDRRQFFHH